MKHLLAFTLFSLFCSCGADINLEPRFMSDDIGIRTPEATTVTLAFVSECRDDTDFLVRIEGRQKWTTYNVGDKIEVPTHIWYEIKIEPQSESVPHKEIVVRRKAGPHVEQGETTKWFPTVSGLVVIDYCA